MSRFGAATPRRRYLSLRLTQWFDYSRAVGAIRFFVDGSFITGKAEPGDVDAVVWLPANFTGQVHREVPEALELYAMLTTRRPEEIFAAGTQQEWMAGSSSSRRHVSSMGGAKAWWRCSSMIANDKEYRRVLEQLRKLESWFLEIDTAPDHPNKGLTKAGIHKMMARLHEQLAVYDAAHALEASQEVAATPDVNYSHV